ncbi:MAG: alkaline phosphatase PhoX [Aliiglaciecola sp.]|uniref:alkaline phosphatase PhoX n=1 Tax=Aliiglaciecola sp. TaxID=1872441 RepID=UPI00329A61BF
MVTRRQFNRGFIAVAFSGLATHLQGGELTRFLSNVSSAAGNLSAGPGALGNLVADPNGIIDLLPGFSYQQISHLGDLMNDGLTVPDRADGMGCFEFDDERVVLVRNHELTPLRKPAELADESLDTSTVYDTDAAGNPLPGGTSNIVYNLKTEKVEYQFMSLLGTIRNCSGGITPWGSWLTCEESVATPSDSIKKDHGYVFEVPSKTMELVKPEPIKAMGRFNHEAACVDPASGIVYLTEDRSDSLFYRYIPKIKGDLKAGGQLQALVIKGKPKFDTRNWQAPQMQMNQEYGCEWIDLDDVESPKDDLRLRGFEQGAALFARGEGIHFGEGEMYFCCTSGGAAKLGQIMRYRPSSEMKEQAGTLSLFVESPNKATFNFGDNLAVAPSGHLIVCEDQYSDTVNNHLKGVSPQGQVYDFAKVRWQTEPAGACFSADGSVLFVNLYSPTVTLAIRGPWESLYA